MRRPRETDLTCDRCATDGAPIIGVIVVPAAQEVRTYCGPCYERTKLARMANREWRAFEATGQDQWDRDLLTSVLTSAGLLQADHSRPV